MANGLADSHNTDAFCLGNLSLAHLQKVVSIDSFGLDVRQLSDGSMQLLLRHLPLIDLIG